MNVFGVDILQLVIYICVAASFIVVVYILKLTRTKTKTEPEPTLETPDKTIKQLITLIDKMWSHSAGLTSSSNSCLNSNQPSTPSKKRTRKKPLQLPSTVKVDEETYTPTEEAKELLETIRKQLGEK